MNKKILKYVEDKGWDLNHDVDGLAFAAERTANLFSDVTTMKVIKFMLGDEPIGCWSHSYGFHTRDGRAMREFFSVKYNEHEQTINKPN